MARLLGVWGAYEPSVPARRSVALPNDETQPDFYADTTVYDTLHAPGTAEDATGLERIARRFLPGRNAVRFLEPACGTARILRLLAKRGHTGAGFDLSEAMIEDARARAERAGLAQRLDLIVADMTDFAGRVSTKSDLAFNLINTIRHLETDDAMLAHFEHTARSLAPRGRYAVGISTTIYSVEQESEDTWAAARGSLRVTQTVNYIPPTPRASRTETVLSHLVIQRPSGTEHRDSTYALRTYSRSQWDELIRASAFEVEAVTDEMGRDVRPPELGYAVYILKPRRAG